MIIENASECMTQRLRCYVWASLFVILLVDIVLGVHFGLRLIVNNDLLKAIGFTIIYTLFAWGLRHAKARRLSRYRNSCESLAGFCDAMGIFILFILLYVYLSYVMAAASSSSYCDALLLSIDRALGFDWLSYVIWVNSHPSVARLYSFAYSEWGPTELIVLFAGLALTHQSRRIYALILSCILGAFICITIACFMPATGISVYLHMTDMSFSHVSVATGFVQVDDLTRLRNGTLHAISTQEFKGMITFPSYHSCLALLLSWGGWTIPWLRVPVLLLNAVMLIATPVNGGHYLADTMVGSLIGILIIIGMNRWMKRGAKEVLPMQIAL